MLGVNEALDALLAPYVAVLGPQAPAYRNHCQRVYALACLFAERAGAPPDKVMLQSLTIASAFHDLGIWTAGSMEYLEPSRQLAEACLARLGWQAHQPLVAAMIAQHHRLSPCPEGGWVEFFRQADWADLTLGLRAPGLDPGQIASVRQLFPNAGFHAWLAKALLAYALRHPLAPLPMLRR